MNQLDTSSIVTTPTATSSVAADYLTDAYAAVRFNALKHGILSRHTVLAHENGDEYQALLTALFDEHLPKAVTEAYLIEELAGIIWRKRRVLQAEGAAINRGLKGAAKNAESVIPAAAPFETGLDGKGTNLRGLMQMTRDEVAASLRDAQQDLVATQKASVILQRGAANAYDKALRALRSDSRDWWEQFVEDEEYTATAEGLVDFIREHLEPVCIAAEQESRHHEAIKAQTLGESLQMYRLEKLTRYETHLDRKFERTLAMLVKLKQLCSAR